MLHAFAAQFFANFSEIAVANFALVAAGTHFDQRVRSQRKVDFVQYGRRQAVLAHHDDRVEMMRSGAQRAAGARGEGGNFGGGCHQRVFLFLLELTAIISRLGSDLWERAA